MDDKPNLDGLMDNTSLSLDKLELSVWRSIRWEERGRGSGRREAFGGEAVGMGFSRERRVAASVGRMIRANFNRGLREAVCGLAASGRGSTWCSAPYGEYRCSLLAYMPAVLLLCRGVRQSFLRYWGSLDFGAALRALFVLLVVPTLVYSSSLSSALYFHCGLNMLLRETPNLAPWFTLNLAPIIYMFSLLVALVT
ncbi:hypothetical protein Tco_0604351 [Tanacetum coccineum]